MFCIENAYVLSSCLKWWADRQTDRRRKQGGSGWSLHYSCSCNGPKLSPYGSSTMQRCSGANLATTENVFHVWTGSLRSALYLSAPVHSHAGNHMPTPRSLFSLLTSQHPTHVPFSFPPPHPPLHWAFEALSLFIPPPPLPALKGWSVTELVASFIGASQQPGDKGQLKCHNVSIFRLCADANAWKEADIQSSALKSWNTVEDGWRQTWRMRTKERRRRTGVRFVIDYAKSQAKREARQRITRGQTETSVGSLFVLDLSPLTKTHNFKHLSVHHFTQSFVCFRCNPVSV